MIFQPKFSELTRIWLQFQNYIYLLSEINQISNTLTNLTEKCLSFDDLAYRLLGESQVQTDSDRLGKTAGKQLILDAEEPNCEIVPYSLAMKVNSWIRWYLTKRGHTFAYILQVELLKFCVWHLTEADGVLMPGNVDMGVCQYQKDCYAFNIPEPVVFFDEDPDK